MPAALLDAGQGPARRVEAAAGSLQDLQNNSNPAKLLDRDGNDRSAARARRSASASTTPAASSPRSSSSRASGRTATARSCSTPAPRASTTTRSATRSASPAAARRSPTRSPASPRSARSTRSAAPRWRSSTSRPRRRCSRRTAQYDSISVKAKDGVSPAALTREIKPLLPETAEVKTGDAQAAADSKDTNESLKFITYFLLGFGGIALFVGAFVILNTLSITVAQRSREFATLRTLGASRRQVMRSVVLEGLVVGLARLGARARARPRHRQGHERAVRRHGRGPAEVRHGARDAHGRSSACSPARSSRSWPASSRRCAPPACRRSRRSARARPPRRRPARSAARTRALVVTRRGAGLDRRSACSAASPAASSR